MPMATYMRRPQANHSPGVCSKASVDGSIKPFDILQSWAEQPVFTWSSQLSAPTACPATSKGKQRTGTSASPDVDNSVLEDQCEGYRRCRSDGGVSIARPAPSPLPGRTYSASVEPSDLAMYCGNMSAPKKLHHYFSSKAEKLKDLSKDGNCNSSSTFDLAVDCTAVVEIPTSINSCIPAVYSTAADSVSERTPGFEAPPHVATVAAGCDPITAALRERLHQLEKRNRALEKKLHQLEKQQQQLLEQEQETQQQQAFSSRSIPVQQQQSPGLDQPIYKQHQATDVHIQDPTNTSSSTAAQCNTFDNSSNCYVVQAPPSPAGQQQQTARADAAFDTRSTTSAYKDPSQQHYQQQQTSSASTEQFQPPRTPELADRISSSGSSSSDSSDSGSDEEQQQDGLDLQSGICGLQREVSRLQMLNGLLQSDYSDLEFVLKETERQRREYAARYAFVVLDHDNDGYISTQQVENYELFATYAPEVLQSAFRHWRWQSGFPGYLNIEDFVRFVEYADDRSSRAAQHFWFSVLDTDGDGHLGWQDMKQLYNAVDKSSAAYVVGFEDLMNQIRDMVEVQKHPELGFTCSELIASKLGAGVIALLTNHNNMLLQRSTAEWGRGDFPL